MRAITFTETVELFTEQCCNCGCLFAFTKDFRNQRLNDGRLFYCPCGHPQSYTNNAAALLAKKTAELEEMSRRLTGAKSEALSLRHAIEAKEAESKRLAARTSNGVCPCCNRSFKALRRHMATQHSKDPRAAAMLERKAASKKP